MNYFKKKLIIALVITLCANFIIPTSVSANVELDLNSPSAILMDAGTGEILSKKILMKDLNPLASQKL